MDAMDEAEQENATKDAIKRTDNGDGTVTLSISFGLDPEVVAEKAKAMGKGVKREDLSDDLGFADDVEEEKAEDDAQEVVGQKRDAEGDDDEDEDPYNGVNVEDTMFSDALDELAGHDETDAEDAKIGRHGVSPLENCRAKDPKFCPYHGQRAWQQQVENDLKAAGVNGATVTVTEDEHKTHLADSGTGRYTVDVKCAAGDEQKVAGVLQGYLQMKGIKDPTYVPAKVGKTARGTHPAVPGRGVVQGPGGADVNFVRDRKANPDDKYGTIQELMDDLMDDPNVDYSNQEQMDMLNDLSDILDNKIAPLVDEQTHELKDPNDQQKYDGLEHEAYDKYHQLSAMVALPNVKSMGDATTAETDTIRQFNSDYKSFTDANDEINNVKKALGWKANAHGSFDKPRGMNIEGHDDAMQFLRNVNHWSKETMVEGQQNFVAAYLKNDLNQARRWLKQVMYAASNAAMVKNSIGAEKTKYLQAIYDAEKANNNPNLATAFPNGRPQ